MARSYDIAILSQKVEYLESAGIELPKVTSSDNGKVLQVVSGKWKKGSKMPDAVSANPEGEITNELTAIQIGDTKYKIIETPKTVLTINANEYTSFGLAFAELKTAYETLTDSEKEKAFIVVNNQIYHNQNRALGTFTLNTIGLTAVNLRSIYLNDGGLQYYLWAAIGTSSTSIVDHTADSQNVDIELKV